jgi:small subunit ribosomal protein S2
VHKRLQRLKELEELDFDAGTSGLTKKELLMRKREMEKLQRSLGGVRDMARVPSAVWIVDTKKEHLAVDEARKLNIPIVAILDTNCDPDEVTFPIPGNDDAIRAVTLLTRVVADAVADGLMTRAGQATGDETAGVELAGDEPLAEWEKELLAGQPEQASVTDEVGAVADAAPGAPQVGAEAAAEVADEAGSPRSDQVGPASSDEANAPATDGSDVTAESTEAQQA